MNSGESASYIWQLGDWPASSVKWAAIAQCSPDTALRDIGELVALVVLRKKAGGGRSTAYELAD